MTTDTNPDRDQHLERCKQRALRYLDQGNVNDAVFSFISDLGKHPGTAKHAVIDLIGMAAGLMDEEKVRSLIVGIN